MEEYLIIGDIAGQYEALTELVEMAPANAIPLSVGDMIDRGPKSKEVTEFFKKNGKAILGNHEHMLLDFYHDGGYYNRDCWFWNGGIKTIRSFSKKPPGEKHTRQEIRDDLKTSGVIDYLESLPLYIELDPRPQDGLKGLVTHAPKPAKRTLDRCLDLGKGFESNFDQQFLADFSILWNRLEPEEIPGTLQIFGHNAIWGHCWFQGDLNGKVVDENAIPWGVCLDSSADEKLTGLHWPSLDIYHVAY